MHCDDKRTLFALKQEIEKTWEELKQSDFSKEELVNKLSQEIQTTVKFQPLSLNI